MKTQISSIFVILIMPFVFAFYYGCEKPNEPPKADQKADNVSSSIKMINYNTNMYYKYHMAVMRGNIVYTIQTFSKFILDGNYNVISDKMLEQPEKYKKWSYLDANESGTRLLLVESIYSDVSCGALYEYDTVNCSYKLIFDKQRNISSARYYPGNDSKIVYYSYGDKQYQGAGYYLYSKTDETDSLLYPYLGSFFQGEMLNGFDIHPSGKSLLIPLSRSYNYSLKSPKIGMVDLDTQRLDTLRSDFDMNWCRVGMWVRYNKDATKILYSCFPYGSYTDVTNDGSEVGIIEIPSQKKIILDVNTNNCKGCESVQLAPNWAPGEGAIIYGSGNVTPQEGYVSTRRLYIFSLTK